PVHPHLPSFPTRRSSDLNVRIGDRFRFNDSGRYYTVVGPMTVFNPEMLVNDGPPGTNSLIEYYGVSPTSGGKVTPAPEFLFLVRSEEHTSELQSLAYLVC